MTLEEIKEALSKNMVVYYKNANYIVARSGDEYFIVCLDGNSHTIGLTHDDGITMNGQMEDFFMLRGTEDMITQLVRDDIKNIMSAAGIGDYDFLTSVLSLRYDKLTAAELNENYIEMKGNECLR